MAQPSFLALLVTFFLASGASKQIEDNVRFPNDIIRIKVTDYFAPFENCTTMVFTPDGFSWGTISPTHGPIISLVYDTNFSGLTGNMIQDKFPIARRRNPSLHCWVTFALLPETAGLFETHNAFVYMPPFIENNRKPHYFIIMTSVKHEVERYLVDDWILDNLRLVEIILVDVTKHDNSSLSFEYHNVYHIKSPAFGMWHSQEWYHIGCESADCFDRLALISKNVSWLNKYFWTMSDIILPSGLVGQVQAKKIRESRHVYKRIADVNSFHGFLYFLILQDTRINTFASVIRLHSLDPMKRVNLNMLRRSGDTFVIYDVHTYSFVSCHGIRRNSAVFGALSSPLDTTSWAWVGICFLTLVLILTSMLKRHVSDAVFLAIGITLENSASLSVYEDIFRRRGYSTFGIYTLVAIWTIFIGTIMTNWYKTWFTMEMIVPMEWFTSRHGRACWTLMGSESFCLLTT